MYFGSFGVLLGSWIALRCYEAVSCSIPPLQAFFFIWEGSSSVTMAFAGAGLILAEIGDGALVLATYLYRKYRKPSEAEVVHEEWVGWVQRFRQAVETGELDSFDEEEPKLYRVSQETLRGQVERLFSGSRGDDRA